MKYAELCIQAELAIKPLNHVRANPDYEVILYLGCNEWKELRDHHQRIVGESDDKSDFYFYGCPVRKMTLKDSFLGVMIGLKK